MALDIGIDVGSSFIRAQGETWLRMENAAPYWFLHPLFEKLRAETGQYIDLYGSATFADEQLGALKKMVAEARCLAEAQPDCWEVQVGVELVPVRRDLCEPLDRGTVLDLVAVWEQVVARAEELGRRSSALGIENRRRCVPPQLRPEPSPGV
jgi:hypothetical protein